MFGYDQGVLGSIIATKEFLEALNIEASDADTISTVTSIYDIGCMVGCLAAAIWGGKLGRKRAIFVGSIIAIVGAAMQACSYSVAQMIVARVVCGVGNGMNTATVPTWVAETAKTNSRGKLIATQLSVAIFGIVIAYWINYGFYQLHGQIVWRFPIAFQIVFALFTLAGLPFLPESPRYLYSKGREADADLVLAALNAQTVESGIVQAAKADIVAAIAQEDQHGEFSLKTIFRDKSGQRIPRRMVLVFVIQMIQEMTGVSVACFLWGHDSDRTQTQIIVYYSSTIFINLGIEGNRALVFGGIISIAFFVGSVLGIVLIDVVGRKNLLYSGSAGMFVAYIVYMLMVKHGGDTQMWVAFAATCVVMASFGWSWLPG